MSDDGYKLVSEVIGSEMDKAWARIFERLSVEAVHDKQAIEAGGVRLSTQDVTTFFNQLGGAFLQVDFLNSSAGSGTMQKCYSHNISAQQLEIGTKGIEGSISIGVKVSF
ncbi:hypothetical protein GA076_23825 [Vibrio parahaemolyticus]|uniref:hypothetical protein n=1 Tax=Vibrio parahaemolyticus TaxID=670 RepID=UPI0006A5E5DF|nr:hypothetical protein [Vibrio parahaemolyticus]EGQ9060228.1 hypothetical protein [Vibrio parahaemolyticus]EGU9031263.1 hypothetical protein [Vibrio parahaemolyticus]EHR0760708.1 hypothetical protein [Vibrio parahaemolyticus]EHR0831323.1 hypothetical protein [Vibrio parahaemolyticus]EHR1160512.1 hypothetical protein [Vibrio parahaemolyticus]